VSGLEKDHRQPNDFVASFKVAKWRMLYHYQGL
jgi:hypothetical protein